VGQQFQEYGYLAAEEAAAGAAAPALAGPYRFLISDSQLNRRGDKVMTKGMDFAAYKKNPVVLWCHNDWDCPIGNAVISVEGDKVFADVTFDVDDEDAAKIAGKVQRRVIRACSVGLRILAMAQRIKDGGHDGWDITESELLELSIVAVPANSRALLNSYSSPKAGLAAVDSALSAVAEQIGWRGSVDELLLMQPAQIKAIRRDLTRAQLAQDLLSRADLAGLAVGFRQLGLAEPWADAAAWQRFSLALADSADPETARLCALAAGLPDLAAAFGEIPKPLAPEPAAAPNADFSSLSAQISAAFAAGAGQLNAAAFRVTGTPALRN